MSRPVSMTPARRLPAVVLGWWGFMVSAGPSPATTLPPSGPASSAASPPGALNLGLRAPRSWQLTPYGSFDLRHHVNSFYERNHQLRRQTPSLHARLQAGVMMYGGQLDFYATVGVLKYAQTQQVLARRPQLALDFYPWRSPYLEVKVYQLLSLPTGGAQEGSGELISTDDGANLGGEGDGRSVALPGAGGDDPAGEGNDARQAASIAYTLGLQPSLGYPVDALAGSWQFQVGTDAFTHLYNRKQYVSLPAAAAPMPGDSQVEDRLLRLGSRQFVNISYSPHAYGDLSESLTVVYDAKYSPTYWQDPEAGLSSRYIAQRRSYVRLRSQVKLSPRVTLLHDAYNFYEGLFAARRYGELRRYRNIVRIICSL